MLCCGCSPGLALQTLSAGGKTWCCPVIMWGSVTAPVGQEVESEWWRQHMAGENKHWSAELKVWGTKIIPFKTKVMHCSCQMQFFHSWHRWDCLCNGSYPGRSGIQLINGTKGSACCSCSLAHCAPEYFVFLSYMELSKLWPVTSYLGITAVAPTAPMPSLFSSWEVPFCLEGWLSWRGSCSTVADFSLVLLRKKN